GRRIEYPGDRLRLRVHVPLGPDRLRRRALLTRIEDPGGAAAAIGAAVDAHAAWVLEVQRHRVVLAVGEPQAVLQHSGAAAVDTGSARIWRVLLAHEDHRDVGLDRLGGGIEVVAGEVDVVAVAVARLGRSPGAVLAATLGHRHPGGAVGVHAVGVVDVQAAV